MLNTPPLSKKKDDFILEERIIKKPQKLYHPKCLSPIKRKLTFEDVGEKVQKRQKILEIR